MNFSFLFSFKSTFRLAYADFVYAAAALLLRLRTAVYVIRAQTPPIMKFSISFFAGTLALAVLRPSVLAFTASNGGIRQRHVASRQRASMTQVREAAPSSTDIPTTKVLLQA